MTRLPEEVAVAWDGRRYRVRVPPEAALPAFLSLEGVANAPPGELVLVLRRQPGLLSLLRPGRTYQAAVTVEPAAYLPDMPPEPES